MNPDERHPERAKCVITASTVPEACGIGYDSRAAWVRGDKYTVDSVMARLLANGTHGEHAAAVTYAEHLINEDSEYLDDEEFYCRASPVGAFGATPDGIVRIKGTAMPLRLVEYKCIDGCGEDRAIAPLKANHVLQLASQLYVWGLKNGHLMYYRSNGEYVVYNVVIGNDTHYEEVVMPWLNEAFAMKAKHLGAPIPEMARGEARCRREIVVGEFLDI
jgi:hypothetical protein